MRVIQERPYASFYTIRPTETMALRAVIEAGKKDDYAKIIAQHLVQLAIGIERRPELIKAMQQITTPLEKSFSGKRLCDPPFYIKGFSDSLLTRTVERLRKEKHLTIPQKFFEEITKPFREEISRRDRLKNNKKS